MTNNEVTYDDDTLSVINFEYIAKSSYCVFTSTVAIVLIIFLRVSKDAIWLILLSYSNTKELSSREWRMFNML